MTPLSWTWRYLPQPPTPNVCLHLSLSCDLDSQVACSFQKARCRLSSSADVLRIYLTARGWRLRGAGCAGSHDDRGWSYRYHYAVRATLRACSIQLAHLTAHTGY